MDKRILDKVKKLNDEANEQVRQEVLKKQELESWHEMQVKKAMPAAKKWVEDRLLDIIAETISKNKKVQPQYRETELNLQYCDNKDNDNRSIPAKAKYLAAQKIDGLTVKQVWVSESQNPNDETGRTWDEAHYEYYVTWK